MLIRHSALYVTAKIVPGLLGMATTAALTRLIDPAQYGLYGLALVVMTFGSTMLFDWLGLSFLRFYQARRGDRLVIDTTVQMFLGLAALTLALASLAWLAGLSSSTETPFYAIGLVLMWSFSWFELVSRFQVAEFRPGLYLRMNLGRAALVMAGAVGAAWLTRSPVWTAAGTAVGTLAAGLLGGAGGVRLGRRHFDPALARAILAFGLPLATSLAMSSLINSGTRLLVQWLGSAEALGLYTAAFMLIQATLGVAAAGIASASYSLAVRAVESGDPEAARRQLLANGSLLLAVLAPASLGMALTAHGIAVTLVGARYVDAVTQLAPWMAAGAFFGGLRAHFLDHAFQLGTRPNLQVGVTAVAAVVAVGLSVGLIPVLGPLGAAVAVTAAMAVSCVHATWAGRQAYPLPLPWDAGWRIAAACAAMSACVLAIPGTGTPAFLLRAATGGACYVAAAACLDVLGGRTHLLRLLARLRRDGHYSGSTR